MYGRSGTASYQTAEGLNAAIKKPSTNIIGVKSAGSGTKTVIAGDKLNIFQQAAATLPALYEQRVDVKQVEVQLLDRPGVLSSFQDIFIPAVLIVAMFMGCTFNAMNIISEKEDGVAFVNEILPMTPNQYILQKVAAAVKDVGILAVHGIAWFTLYVLISTQRKRHVI